MKTEKEQKKNHLGKQIVRTMRDERLKRIDSLTRTKKIEEITKDGLNKGFSPNELSNDAMQNIDKYEQEIEQEEKEQLAARMDAKKTLAIHGPHPAA